MNGRVLAIALAMTVALALSAIPYAHATTSYFGPSFEVSSTSPGGPVSLTISTTSDIKPVSPPSSSGTPCQEGQTCSFPLEACTDSSTFFYSIREITITDPNGNRYEIGSSVLSGMYWPTAYGGPNPTGPDTLPLSDGLGTLGDALNVTLGDSFVVPFGAGAGGFSFTTSLGSPPQTHSPEGPYYWWTTAGSIYGANKRLDLNPSINPTSISGTYTVDIKGYAVCSSLVPFESQLQFTELISVPQFTAPLAFTVAIAFLGVALLRGKSRFAIQA